MSGEKIDNTNGNPAHKKLIAATKGCFNGDVGSGILVNGKPSAPLSPKEQEDCAAALIRKAGEKMGGVNEELVPNLVAAAKETYKPRDHNSR